MKNPEDHIPHVSPVWPHLLETIIVKGEGTYVWDKSGHRYLDFTSGIGVTNTGHCHPRIVAAVREQTGRLLHRRIAGRQIRDQRGPVFLLELPEQLADARHSWSPSSSSGKFSR